MDDKRLQLRGFHGEPRPYMERAVFVGRHEVVYRTYRDDCDEELWLNGTLIASWTWAKDEHDYSVADRFFELTGLYPHCWDVSYGETCWPGYQDADWYWREVSRR